MPPDLPLKGSRVHRCSAVYEISLKIFALTSRTLEVACKKGCVGVGTFVQMLSNNYGMKLMRSHMECPDS